MSEALMTQGQRNYRRNREHGFDVLGWVAGKKLADCHPIKILLMKTGWSAI
jgi:hypothetical protein